MADTFLYVYCNWVILYCREGAAVYRISNFQRADRICFCLGVRGCGVSRRFICLHIRICFRSGGYHFWSIYSGGTVQRGVFGMCAGRTRSPWKQQIEVAGPMKFNLCQRCPTSPLLAEPDRLVLSGSSRLCCVHHICYTR